MKRRTLPPGAKWVVLPSGARRVEMVLDIGIDPATGRRQQIRRRFKTVDEAIDAYTKVKSDTRDGTYVRRSAMTVGEMLDLWLAGRHSLRETTAAGYRTALKPVIAAFSEMPVQNLTKQHVLGLIVFLRDGSFRRADGRKCKKWSGRTINLMLFVLRSALDDAWKQGFVSRNIVRLIDRFPQKKSEMKTFTKEQMRKVIHHARHSRLEVAWRLAFYGFRRGEIAGLRWSDIDYSNLSISVLRPRLSVDGGVVESDPKTEKGKRTLPLTSELLEALQRCQAQQIKDREAALEAYGDSGYVITNELGRPLHPETLSSKWEQLLIAAGVPKIRLHDARHTCATLMHLEGVSIATIAAWLGHADPAFTLRTYVHSQSDALSEAAHALTIVTDT